jgi:Raf kinase inhibitor-like YbhB/YbcL family protein
VSAGAGTGNAAGTGIAGNGVSAIAGAAGSGAATAGSGAAGVGAAVGGGAGGAVGGALALMSDAFKDGDVLPNEYRCDAQSPALSWTAGPSGTMSYAVVLKDVTPNSFSMNYMHWVIYDIPASVTSLPVGVKAGAMVDMPAGAKQGSNYKPVTGFSGPCAPSGTNMYKFTLYAVDVAMLPGLTGTPMDAQVETALEGSHKLATATLNISSMP